MWKRRGRDRKLGMHPAISHVFWSGAAMMKYLRLYLDSFPLLFFCYRLAAAWLEVGGWFSLCSDKED